MKIDLHAHSTASDGTDTPAELVRHAAAVGLDAVAITDHDGTGGWAEAVAALPRGLTLVPGVELSAEHGGVPLHVLGYLIDPAYSPLDAEMIAIRDSRVHRARRIVEAMAADGHPVSWERTLARADGAVGRPHIASELVAAGLVPSVSDAFTDDWIGSNGRYYRAEHKVPALTAIRLIRDAGGVAVFAHPLATKRGEVVDEAAIVAMCEAGLAGLEVDHPDHDDAARARLRSLAADLGLLVTGSSDYHGSRKPTPLGANMTSPEAYDAIVAAATGTAVVTRERVNGMDIT
ncbi:MAG TPA: PHP domain-containing protein [Mycobacteriales bacterium]